MGNDLKRELAQRLRAINDDDEFAICTTVIIGTDRNADEFLAFCDYAESVGDTVTHDDAIYLAIALDEEGQTRTSRRNATR